MNHRKAIELPHPVTVRALDRGLSLLEVLMSRSEACTLGELCLETGLRKTTVFRLMKTLLDRGFVSQDASGHYRPGWRVVELGTRRLQEIDIRQVARPYLRQVWQVTGETCGLYLRDGIRRVCVEQVETSHGPLRASRIGHTMPLTSGSTGLVLLAWLSDEEVQALLSACPPPHLTEQSFDAAAFRHALGLVRRAGFASTEDQTNPGVSSLAVPIRDYSMRVVAALSVSGPTVRWHRQRKQQFLAHVLSAARSLSEALGFRAARPAARSR